MTPKLLSTTMIEKQTLTFYLAPAGHEIIIERKTAYGSDLLGISVRGRTPETPDYKEWNVKKLTADAESIENYFIGRRLTHLNDPLAAWTSPRWMFGDKAAKKAAILLAEVHNKNIADAKEAHNHPLYKALEPLTTVIEQYRTDFTYHDARILAQNPQAAIIQMDNYGTWITTDLAPLDAQVREIRKAAAYLVTWNGRDAATIKIKKLNKETARPAFDLIERKHQQRKAR